MRVMDLIGVAAVLAALSVPTLARAETDEATLAAARIELDKAFEARDRDKIRAMMTDDHVAVTDYYRGAIDLATQLDQLGDIDVKVSNFSPAQVELVSDDLALVTFEVDFEGTFKGRPLPRRVFTSEIWQRTDGVWRQRFYQETPLEVHR